MCVIYTQPWTPSLRPDACVRDGWGGVGGRGGVRHASLDGLLSARRVLSFPGRTLMAALTGCTCAGGGGGGGGLQVWRVLALRFSELPGVMSPSSLLLFALPHCSGAAGAGRC